MLWEKLSCGVDRKERVEREGTSRAAEQGKDGRGKSQGEQAEMLSNSEAHLSAAKVAAQPQEQLAFRSATAAAPARL